MKFRTIYKKNPYKFIEDFCGVKLRWYQKIMDRVEEKIIETKRKVHKFYCDKCGEYLGEEEDKNGYYKKFGCVNHGMNVGGRRYCYRRHLCDRCVKNLNEDFCNLLEILGYVKEQE